MSRARPLVLPCSSDAFVLVSALVAGWRCTVMNISSSVERGCFVLVCLVLTYAGVH